MIIYLKRAKIQYIFGIISLFGFYFLVASDCAPLINFNDDCDARRIDFIALEFNYGLSPADLPGDQITITTTGTGTTGETSGLGFTLTPTLGSTVTVTTQRTVPLNPRDEAYAIFAARFQGPIAELTRWIGFFDTANGMAVGIPFNGTFSLFYRNDSVDTIVPQASFNVDPLDGTGPSGFVYVPTNLNTFRLSYIWYGTNLIRYQILDTDGEWITFHEIENVNSQTTAAFSNPYLPMSMTQINDGVDNAATSSIETTAWRAGLIHSGDNNAGIRTFEFEDFLSFTSGDAGLGENYMFTLRNKAVVGGETNRVTLHIDRFGGGNALDITTPVIIRYYKNSTLTGAVFTDVDTANSVVEVDTSAATFTTDHLLWMLGGAQLVFEDAPELLMEFFLGPEETLTVTAEKTEANVDITFYATVIWEEWQ